MLENKISRRTMLRHTGLAVLGGALANMVSCTSASEEKRTRPFRISMNVSTISAYRLSVPEQIEACAEAGFDGIELWGRDVKAFVDGGGSYEALKRMLEGSGLVLENMISFAPWFADDPEQRKEGLRMMRDEMERVARLGGRYIAAPAQGVTTFDRSRLPEYAERYRALLEIGAEMQVTPLLELWGAGVLNQVADAMAVALGAGHPEASVLLDFYHLYRGGNRWDSLKLVNGAMLPVFHINDYPATPPRTELKDADRVFPGDGICPFRELLPLLYETGFRGALSVELFNKSYWEKMDARTVLKTSYEKTAALIDACM